jgi:hypothetical protein
MLDAVRLKEMTAALDALPCRVVLPPGWKDFYQRRGPQVWPGDNRRRYVRSHFPLRAVMELLGTLPAVPRSREEHVVLMKDISRGGAGFLHAAPLYPGERLRLWLPTGSLEYTVVRCARHHEACYEIGAEIAADGAG